MNIVAWDNQVLKSLVLSLNVEISEDFYIITNLVPVKAQQIFVAIYVLLKLGLLVLNYGRKEIVIFFPAFTIGYHRLAIHSISKIVEPREGLHIGLIVLQLLVQIPLDAESYAKRSCIEVEHC